MRFLTLEQVARLADEVGPVPGARPQPRPAGCGPASSPRQEMSSTSARSAGRRALNRDGTASQPKTKTAVRSVSMPPHVVEALRRHRLGRGSGPPRTACWCTSGRDVALDGQLPAPAPGGRRCQRPGSPLRPYDMRHRGVARYRPRRGRQGRARCSAISGAHPSTPTANCLGAAAQVAYRLGVMGSGRLALRRRRLDRRFVPPVGAGHRNSFWLLSAADRPVVSAKLALYSMPVARGVGVWMRPPGSFGPRDDVPSGPRVEQPQGAVMVAGGDLGAAFLPPYISLFFFFFFFLVGTGVDPVTFRFSGGRSAD